MSTYRRVLLKLSGESLGGPSGKGIDENWLAAYAEEVAAAVKNGLQVAIVYPPAKRTGFLQIRCPESLVRCRAEAAQSEPLCHCPAI